MKPHEDLLRLCAPGLSFSEDERQECKKNAEVVRLFLHERALSFLAGRVDEPLLEIYMSDGTPVTTMAADSDRMVGLCCPPLWPILSGVSDRTAFPC